MTEGRQHQHELVFLVDLDNTLLDHDEFKNRLGVWVSSLPAAPPEHAFWESYEAVRIGTGIVDLFETSRRYAAHATDPAALAELLATGLLKFPLQDLVYDHSAAALRYLGSIGTAVVLCDGHEQYQRHKLRSTGLLALVEDVLVYDHKERHLAEIVAKYPARHYVMIDDKPQIHAAMKLALGEQMTTVQVVQGHYARAQANAMAQAADLVIQHLGELVGRSGAEIRSLAAAR